ncbi:MAG: hypothetical protein WCK84_14115, partial [Bacteroidota bacterium]
FTKILRHKEMVRLGAIEFLPGNGGNAFAVEEIVLRFAFAVEVEVEDLRVFGVIGVGHCYCIQFLFFVGYLSIFNT